LQRKSENNAAKIAKFAFNSRFEQQRIIKALYSGSAVKSKQLLQAAPLNCGMCVVCHFLQEDQVNQLCAPFMTIFLYSSSFPVLIRKFPNKSPNTVAS